MTIPYLSWENFVKTIIENIQSRSIIFECIILISQSLQVKHVSMLQLHHLTYNVEYNGLAFLTYNACYRMTHSADMTFKMRQDAIKVLPSVFIQKTHFFFHGFILSD